MKELTVCHFDINLQPEKVSLLIELASIESIGNYGTGKAEHMFQVKSKGYTTLHKCASDTDVQRWVDKVMSALMGGNEDEEEELDEDDDSSSSVVVNSDDDDSTTAEANDGASSSEGEADKSKSKDKKDKKEKEKEKSSKGDKASSKSAGASASASASASTSSSALKSSGKGKTGEVGSSKDKTKESKDKKDKNKQKYKKLRDKKASGTMVVASKDQNGKKGAGSAPADDVSRRSKSVSAGSKPTSNTDSYVPQWMAHYNGIKQQERQKHFESLSTQELVKLVAEGLEQAARTEKEQVLQEWAAAKRAKLADLHATETSELEKKQQKEIDDINKRQKEFTEQGL